MLSARKRAELVAETRLHRRLAVAVGRHLRDARLARGITQEAAAALAGMPRPNLSRLERGHATPDLATLARVTRALRISFATVSAVVDGVCGVRTLPDPMTQERRIA